MMEMATEPYGCKSDLLTVHAHRYLQMKGQSKEGLSASQESWILQTYSRFKDCLGTLLEENRGKKSICQELFQHEEAVCQS